MLISNFCKIQMSNVRIPSKSGYQRDCVWGLVGVWDVCLSDVHTVTIHPDFPGQSWFLTTCPRKKSQFSRDTHLSCFCLVSRICPDLPISAAVCLCIDGQKLAQILSVYIKNCWQLGLYPEPRWWNSRCSLRPPSQTPDSSRLWCLHLRFALIPGCGAQIMVTLDVHMSTNCLFCAERIWLCVDILRWSKSSVSVVCLQLDGNNRRVTAVNTLLFLLYCMLKCK